MAGGNSELPVRAVANRHEHLNTTAKVNHGNEAPGLTDADPIVFAEPGRPGPVDPERTSCTTRILNPNSGYRVPPLFEGFEVQFRRTGGLAPLAVQAEQEVPED